MTHVSGHRLKSEIAVVGGANDTKETIWESSQTEKHLLRYLVLVELYDHEEVFYAEDLLDMIQLLAWFAPIVAAQINT